MTLPAGVTASPVPAMRFRVSAGVGAEPLSPAGLKPLLVGSKTTSGTGSAIDLTPTEVLGVEDAETKFGARSRLAAMCRAFRAIAPRGRLYGCSVAPPAGGVAATAILVFAGPATGAGVARFRVAGRLQREVVIPSGATAAQAAALVAGVLAEDTALPATGAVGGGGSEHILTLTAATVGAVSSQLRVQFEVTAPGITVALNGATAAGKGKGYFGGGSAIPTSGRSTGSATFPVRLSHGLTLVVSIDGEADDTATFDGYARRLTGVGGGHLATDGLSLVLVVNGITRTVTFGATEDTPAEYAATINAGVPGVYADVATGQVRITTDRKGSGASLVVDPTTAADVLTALGFTSGQVAASLGSSNVSDIEAVTAAEFETIVEAAVSGCAAGADADNHPFIASLDTDTDSSVRVQASSTAETLFGFDTITHTGTAGSGSTAGVGTINTGTAGSTPTGLWAAIGGAHYDRIIVDCDDDTNRAAFELHLQTQSGIETGHRCMGVVASMSDDTDAVKADAVALNEERFIYLHQRRGHQTCAEVAAAFVAAKIHGNGGLPGEDTYRAAKANGLTLWPAILATDEEERLAPPAVDSLLRAGVTPIGADGARDGYACVVRPVTTRTKNAAGGTSYLVAATSKIAVADFVAAACEAWCRANYADKNIAPDPASPELAPSSPYVTYPVAIRLDMLSILYRLEDEGLLVDVAANADNVTVTTETIEGVTYAIVSVPFAVIPHLDSVVGDARQVG